MSLRTEVFDYSLPAELIAQTPVERRDKSKLLVVDRVNRTTSHGFFSDLPKFLRRGDTLFRNNASVLPARLHAQRPTGGAVECFLLRPTERPNLWVCLAKPARKLGIGATFKHREGAFSGEVIATNQTEASLVVQFTTPGAEPISAIANRLGSVPLPPYIRRADDSTRSFDKERYQTVYADTSRQVAVAAPTAGLHFTETLLAELASNGVETADITLHVGLGTFRPIATDTIEDHQIHRELYELPDATQRALFPPLQGRRIAVGTTAVRSIEDFLANHSRALGHQHTAEAGIFIYPPREFRGVDALITNFHQPRSTLLCLVAAFLTPGSTDGVTWLREIYAEAIARRYRFFSYGDAMLIL